MTDAIATGLKHDHGKPPMELLDRTALEATARVLGYGAEKYDTDNWRGGIKFRRLIGAAMRHLTAISDGEDIDDESGHPHAAHVMCEMMFLIWMMKHRPELDDRYQCDGEMQLMLKFEETVRAVASRSVSPQPQE